MKLNRSTSHAIRILIECARSGGQLVKVADLAERLQITPQNVFKIVHLLSRARLVVGTRGRHGGVQLARAAHDMRIGDIVRAMEATEIELSADGATRTDEKIAAGVNRLLDDALEAFIAILNQQTLADLAASTSHAVRNQAAVPRGRRPTSGGTATTQRAPRRNERRSARGA